MNAKTYRVKNLREAIDLIREELGPDASVLHTRRLESGWLGRLRGAPMLEVVAAADADVPSRLDQADPDFDDVASNISETKPSVDANATFADALELTSTSEAVGDVRQEQSFAADPTSDDEPQPAEVDSRFVEGPLPRTWRDVRGRVESSSSQTKPELKIWTPSVESLADKAGSGSSSEEATTGRLRDFRSAVTRASAENLSNETRYASKSDSQVDQAKVKPRSFREMLYGAGFTSQAVMSIEREWRHARSKSESILLTEWLGSYFEYLGPIEAGPLDPQVVAFVGPTGVGKTTTLAKLAAEYQLRQGLNVGLITVDTFRIAAVDQLRTYARIMNVPMEVVRDTAEMQRAIDRLSDNDLILIDTAGGSPRDSERIAELKEAVLSARPTEINLVLSSGVSANGFRQAVEAFGEMGVSSLTLTKIDESNGVGHLWNELHDSHLPLRYLTHGQNVPDDYQVATPNQIGNALLGSNAALLNQLAEPQPKSAFSNFDQAAHRIADLSIEGAENA